MTRCARCSGLKKGKDMTRRRKARKQQADGQNPALQLAELKKAERKTIFKGEELSGAATKRPALPSLSEEVGRRRHGPFRTRGQF